MLIEILFWSLCACIVYTYIGYALVLMLLNTVKTAAAVRTNRVKGDVRHAA